MAARKKAVAPPPREPEPVVPRPGMPVRLLPHDWPFLYSVLANGDLVMNQRLPMSRPKANRKRTDGDGDDALM